MQDDNVNWCNIDRTTTVMQFYLEINNKLVFITILLYFILFYILYYINLDEVTVETKHGLLNTLKK